MIKPLKMFTFRDIGIFQQASTGSSPDASPAESSDSHRSKQKIYNCERSESEASAMLASCKLPFGKSLSQRTKSVLEDSESISVKKSSRPDLVLTLFEGLYLRNRQTDFDQTSIMRLEKRIKFYFIGLQYTITNLQTYTKMKNFTSNS